MKENYDFLKSMVDFLEFFFLNLLLVIDKKENSYWSKKRGNCSHIVLSVKIVIDNLSVRLYSIKVTFPFQDWENFVDERG